MAILTKRHKAVSLKSANIFCLKEKRMVAVNERRVGLVVFHVRTSSTLMLRCTGSRVWVFPEGQPHPGEADRDALKRVLVEEARLLLADEVPLQELTTVRHEFQGSEGLICKDATCYLARFTMPRVPAAVASDDGHDAVRWWQVGDLATVPYKYPADLAIQRYIKQYA